MRKKPNIAFVFDMIFTPIGGSTISTQRFASLLEKKGWNITYITGREKIDYTKIKTNGEIVKFPSASIPFAPKNGRFCLPFFSDIKKIYKKHHIDIVHVFYPTFLGYKAIRAAKKFNIPVITSNHIQPENLLPSNKLMDIGIFKKIIINNLKKFHNLSDVSITPSIFGKNKLLSYGVSNKITILSNGIDRKKFIHSKKGDSLRKKYGFHKDDFIFMSVSRLTPEKNFFILIEALKLIPGQRIKIMLLGTGPLEKKLRSAISRNRLEDRFVLAGYVDDLPGHYSMADVYVHPSKIELEGMVVMEAMSCGLPILVSNSEESASRFFVANNGMLFDPDNPIELASRMIEMAGDYKKLEGFSKESIKSAKEHDINKSVSKLEKIYFDYSKK